MIHYKEPDQQLFSVVLEDTILERMVISPHVFIAIENLGNKDAWLLNYPDPPYDPNDNEQKRVERKDI